MDTLVLALDRMVSQFEERALQESPPMNEAGLQALLHHALAEAYGIAASSIIPEWSGPSGIYDLLIPEQQIVLELKYHRPIPSGHNRPMTAQFGDLLLDMRKLAAVMDSRRFLVLLTDDAGSTYLRNRGLLPVRLPTPKRISDTEIRALPATARRHAISQGSEWIPIEVQRVWSTRVRATDLAIAWEVIPIESTVR